MGDHESALVFLPGTSPTGNNIPNDHGYNLIFSCVTTFAARRKIEASAEQIRATLAYE